MWFKDAFPPDSTLRSIVRFEDDEVVWDKLLTIDKILGIGNPNRTGIFPRALTDLVEKSPPVSPRSNMLITVT